MSKKLSICMIVKNEEKNLYRCLNSLKPILEKKHTELIIVDTGSTDRTIEIAEDFTEKVFCHEWNGNFSDMRNISLKYATGEWVFILDADEELETPDEFNALLEGTQLQYSNTVRIITKSLLSLKSNKYVSHVQERFFRNDGTFRYSGTIHNQPGFKHPVITDKKIMLMHYGYDNEDKELMEMKFKRTATMLKKELEKSPNNVYYRYQLSRSYGMHGDYEIALSEMKKAYEYLNNQPNDFISQCYYVFGEYARMSLNAKKYEQAIKISQEGLTLRKQYLDLYNYMGFALISMNQYEEGVRSLVRYLEFYEKYYRNELDLSNYSSVEMYTLDDDAYEKTLEVLVNTIYKNQLLFNNLDKYRFWINKIKNESKRNRLLAYLFIIEKDYEGLFETYKSIKKEDKDRYSLINDIEVIKKDLKSDEKKKIEIVFSHLIDDYGVLNQIRVTERRNKLLLHFIKEFNITEFTDELIFEFINYLIENNYLNRFFKIIDIITIKKIVMVLIEKEDRENYFLESLRNDFFINDYHNNRISIAISSVLLRHKIIADSNGKIQNDDLMGIFNTYISNGNEYIKSVYNLDKIRLTFNTLSNKEDKFFILLYLAKQSLQNNDFNHFKKYILLATKEKPYLSDLLKEYVSSQITDTV